MTNENPSYERALWPPDPQSTYDGDPDTDATPEGLLDVARHVWLMMCGLFGTPERIAQGAISAIDHKHIRFWLRHIERLVRCILLMMVYLRPSPDEADVRAAWTGSLKPRAAREGSAGPVAETPAKTLALPDPANPDSWRTSFLLLRAPRGGDRVIASFDSADPDAVAKFDAWLAKREAAREAAKARCWGEAPSATVNALALARRVESVLRVLNNPAAYADRLWRKLSRTPRWIRFLPCDPAARPISPCGFAQKRAVDRLDVLQSQFWPPGILDTS